MDEPQLLPTQQSPAGTAHAQQAGAPTTMISQTAIPVPNAPVTQPTDQPPLTAQPVITTAAATAPPPSLMNGLLGGFKMMFGKKSSSAETKPVSPQGAPQPVQLSTDEIDMSLKDIIAPPSIEVDFNNIQVGERYYRTLFASGYPRFVGPNWLSPLINFEHSLMISTFYYPVDSKAVLQKLKRKISEMEASLFGDAEKGKVLDPTMKITLSDAHQLQEAIAGELRSSSTFPCTSPLMPTARTCSKRSPRMSSGLSQR